MSTPLWAISPLTGAQQLWNQWEIQCLVLVSFSLQVFLLFFSGVRKRHTSRVLSLLLWVAYLLADYVATFALGRLTLHLNDPRHLLVLFWTPFLLLHLGGQETIAAFSTEDSLLWKRHLLSLVSQVSLAVYIVGKSWHVGSGDSKHLVAPIALMFIAGTIKYVERTWALMSAGSTMTPGSGSMTDRVLHVEGSVIDDAKSYFGRLNEVVSSARPDGKVDYEGLVGVAGKGLRMCVEFLTDMTPFLMWHKGDIIDRTINKLQDLGNRHLQVLVAYNLAEIHLSLIYDFFYTKYGVLQYHLNQINSGIERLVTFGATSTALALFLQADLNGFFFNLSRAKEFFTGIVLMWHITTEMCFYTDNEVNPTHKAMSMDLSNYVLYLVGKCGVKSGSNGYFELGKLRRDVRKTLSQRRFSKGRLKKSEVVLYGYEGHGYFSARASAIAKEVLKITSPDHRWELIATLWVEMLCYLAPNCEAGYHIKNLATGGEFITHVRILQIILGVPFLREPWQAEAKDDAQYSDFIMF